MNTWIEHVKKYAKEHNISYGEAISKARSSYKPTVVKAYIAPEDKKIVKIDSKLNKLLNKC